MVGPRMPRVAGCASSMLQNAPPPSCAGTHPAPNPDIHSARVSAWPLTTPARRQPGAPTAWPGLTRHIGGGDDPVPLDLPVLLAEHALGNQHAHPRLGLQQGGCGQLRGVPGWEQRGSEALRAEPPLREGSAGAGPGARP